MQITFDPLELTEKQREHIAGFIMTFPANDWSSFTENIGGVPFRKLGESDIVIGEPEPIASDVPSAQEAFGTSDVFSQLPVDGPRQMEQIAALTATNPHLDKNGLPWDDRIHSGSKARNADGSWRYKRGVADTWVVEVEKELRVLMAIPTLLGARRVELPSQAVDWMRSVAPPPPAMSFPQDPRDTLTPLMVPAVPPVPAVPAVPSPVPTASPVSSSPSVPPPPPPAASSEGPFVTLVKKVGALIPAGKLTQEEVKSACLSVGVNELYLLSNRHDLIPAVDLEIDKTVYGR